MALRQLAERNRDGVVVQLFWDDSAPPECEVLVEYRDERQDMSYRFYPPPARALAAFYHPNAYARPGGSLDSPVGAAA